MRLGGSASKRHPTNQLPRDKVRQTRHQPTKVWLRVRKHRCNLVKVRNPGIFLVRFCSKAWMSFVCNSRARAVTEEQRRGHTERLRVTEDAVAEAGAASSSAAAELRTLASRLRLGSRRYGKAPPLQSVHPRLGSPLPPQTTSLRLGPIDAAVAAAGVANLRCLVAWPEARSRSGWTARRSCHRHERRGTSSTAACGRPCRIGLRFTASGSRTPKPAPRAADPSRRCEPTRYSGLSARPASFRTFLLPSREPGVEQQ